MRGSHDLGTVGLSPSNQQNQQFTKLNLLDLVGFTSYIEPLPKPQGTGVERISKLLIGH
jgi:hypothetical protein